MAEQPIAENLVEVRDLAVEFVTGEQVQRVVEGVTFDIRKGETLALVGESRKGRSSSTGRTCSRPTKRPCVKSVAIASPWSSRSR